MNKINQYEPLINYDDLTKEFSKYFKSRPWITEYKKTEELENKIKKFLGVKHCFMVNNGTVSLSLALLAHNVKPGDRVIVPALSMIATANAVRFIGAKPIFVDIDEVLCLDYLKAMSIKAQAIIYVTLNGRNGCPLVFVNACKEHDIPLIGDQAQSFGSKTPDFSINSYSFSMPKIITTGQGGCLTTNNNKLAKKIKHLKDHGRDNGGNDLHNYFGINSKITDLQAIVGLEQIKDIHWRVKRKKEIYRLYHSLLKDVKEIEFIPTFLTYTTPWFIDIYVNKRDGLIKFLKDNSIGSRKIYPVIPHQKVYNTKESFPVAEHYSSKGLWLPSSLNLIDIQIDYICNKIKEFYI